MSRYGNVEFEKQVDKAYDILWEMYRPSKSDRKGVSQDFSCMWDMKQEQKLVTMINAIDNELGR